MIEINKDVIDELSQELRVIGIDAFHVYQDLDSLPIYQKLHF